MVNTIKSERRKKFAETYLGKTCIRCGSQERYVSTKQCVNCAYENKRKQTLKRRQEAQRELSESLTEQLRIQQLWKTT